jgi:hypothetical protein
MFIEIVSNIKSIIVDIIEDIIKKNKEKTMEIKTNIANQIKKYELDIKAFEWFLFFTNQSNKIVFFFDHIYNSNANVRLATDIVIYFWSYLFCIIVNQRIYPFNKNWICTSVLMEKNYNFLDKYYLNESYEHINKIYIEQMNETNDAISSIVATTDNILEGMITVKVNNQYINRVFFNNTKPTAFDWSLPLVQSKHQFLSIKYTHPNMKDAIFIDIDKEYYYAYNEILSPLFVKRYLEYQPLIYDFDMDYELEIMDNDINTFVINSKQYILLVESTYTIKNIETIVS